MAAPGTRDYGSLAVLHALTVEVAKLRGARAGALPSGAARALELPAHHTAARRRSSRPASWPRVERDRARRLLEAAQDARERPARRGPRAGGRAAARSRLLLRRLGIDPRARAESLAPERLLALARALAGGGRRRRGSRAVELSELLERLAELAREAGLEVRELRAGAEGEPPLASGVCRVRGETWVLLAAVGRPRAARRGAGAGVENPCRRRSSRAATCRPPCASGCRRSPELG